MTQRSPGQPFTASSPNSAGNVLQTHEGHDEGFVFVDWVRNNALANPIGLPARFLSSLSEAPVALRVCAGLVPGLYVLFELLFALFNLSMIVFFNVRISGYIMMKVSKMVALGLGGGILVFLVDDHLLYLIYINFFK